MRELVGAWVQLAQDLPILAWIYGVLYAGREVLFRGPGRSTALGRWLAGTRRLDASASRRAQTVRFDDPEEGGAFRRLAESLIHRLELRPDCRDELLIELGRERELVLAWLAHEARSPERGRSATVAHRQDDPGADEAA